MKVYMNIFVMALSAILILTACGSEGESLEDANTSIEVDDSDKSGVSEEVTASESNTDDDGLNVNSDDDKIVPDRKAEVSGIVKNIIGNEVTISLLLKESDASGESSSEDSELTEEEKAEKQAANQAARESGEKGGGSGSGMTDVEVSGETVDIIIPVGTSVVKSSGVGDGEFIYLNIADIYQGDSVKVWIVEGGDLEVSLAEFVQVLSN